MKMREYKLYDVKTDNVRMTDVSVNLFHCNFITDYKKNCDFQETMQLLQANLSRAAVTMNLYLHKCTMFQYIAFTYFIIPKEIL